jgi:hypothetical protein
VVHIVGRHETLKKGRTLITIGKSSHSKKKKKKKKKKRKKKKKDSTNPR